MTKYEVYVPLKYNDGTAIEAEKIDRVGNQLAALFGAVTVSSLFAPYQGKWRYGGVEYVDDIITMSVIVDTNEKTDAFFADFKEQLKDMLQQIDILITAEDIRTI